jgi:hypothetical protein
MSDTKTLTASRGSHYGHPRDHFATTRGMYLARAATDPMLADNWADCQGYARTAKMVLGLED